MGSFTFFLAFILIFLVFSILMLSTAIRIVPEYQRAVVFRLGRCLGSRGPGIIILIPFVDLAIMVDLREQTRTLANQSAISNDNVRLTVDVSWRYRVIDPTESVLKIANLDQALEKVARQAWVTQVETQAHQDLLHYRLEIRDKLLDELRRASQGWGIEVTGVQLGEIQRGA